MRIAVNTRLLIENKLEGIGWFTYEVFKRISRNHPEHQFIFIFDRTHSKKFVFSDNVEVIEIGPPARHPILFKIWFDYSLTTALKRVKADLFVSPDGYLSLNTKVPSLAVMHDLNFEHYPQDIPKFASKHYRWYFPKYAKKAERIATVSEFSKQDIIEQYSIVEDKIDVVYNGVNESFKPIGEDEKSLVRNTYSQGSPYFVFVGSLHPRKNIKRLLEAFDSFKQEQLSDTKLLIVGEKYWWNKDISDAYEAMYNRADVIFTGRLENDNLNKVISASRAMTFVPYFEGFGIPILEAFACETAVICSNITSMPEVASDAGLLVDPFSVDSIKEGMLQLNSDDALRNSLIQKGKERLKDFSWDKTAEALWDSIEKLASQNNLQ